MISNQTKIITQPKLFTIFAKDFISQTDKDKVNTENNDTKNTEFTESKFIENEKIEETKESKIEMAIPLDEPFDDDEDEENLYEHYRVKVDGKQELLRIDKYLMERLPRVTRNRLKNAIKGAYVKVNEKLVKPSYKVLPHDVITVRLPDPVRDLKKVEPENIPLNVVYEDKDLMVVQKPAGMVSHPATNNWTGTLANAVAYHMEQNGEDFLGLSHRIDKDTTGLLVIAKTPEARDFIGKQFFHHTIERTYLALVWGEVKEDKGTIEGHIARGKNDRRIMTVLPDGERGKRAITHYKVVKRLRYVTLVQCNLETGRTHQIRAHMKHIGHPLFNDSFYGGNRILQGSVFSKYKSFVENCFGILPRQALHAKSLGFEHPTTKEWIQFDSELPKDITDVIEKWENYVKYT
ncbi:pseudouridine synthase, RluA family [Bernardetia litoralis DSM 6794]|uniref:Pseudouridine synthase, RluA family n=1 Tax=Bernardetia litoralis (strain ATCC 23117 / DSM 6794 / NBRC 15988 / NCIMB 1366 / Fx l1 / Sio-4) TaxID=880071 RepID=I4ANZ2_BERLS|nr:pseudouridine synthase, RluA family [Bernardetia litoralis DSM 6794]